MFAQVTAKNIRDLFILIHILWHIRRKKRDSRAANISKFNRFDIISVKDDFTESQDPQNGVVTFELLFICTLKKVRASVPPS